MMRRIGEVLDLGAETELVDADAAVLFHLSLNPRHRRAAQSWTKGDELQTSQFFDTYVQENWVALAAFYRLSSISNPSADAAWWAGPVACTDDWFDLPIKGGTA